MNCCDVSEQSAGGSITDVWQVEPSGETNLTELPNQEPSEGRALLCLLPRGHEDIFREANRSFLPGDAQRPALGSPTAAA